MKPVFKCDYCDFMGTEPEVKKHEVECPENYTRRSCFTCKHRGYKGLGFKCAKGREIPDGKMYEFCPKYERGKSEDPVASMFDLMLGRKKDD